MSSQKLFDLLNKHISNSKFAMEHLHLNTLVPLAILLVFGLVVIQAPKWTNSFIIKNHKLAMGVEAINLTLTKDPMKLYQIWREEAKVLRNVNLQPNAVTLSATNGINLSNDIIMIREISDKGFKFYTNSNSTLSQYISKNPEVSFSAVWTFMKTDGSFGIRYVKVQGSSTKLSQLEKQNFFKSEPIMTKIRILLKTDKNEKKESIFTRLTSLLESYNQNPKEFLNGKDIPSNWEGYLIAPKSLEFYQGTKDTIGNRLLFTKRASNSDKPLPVGGCSGEKGWTFREMEP